MQLKEGDYSKIQCTVAVRLYGPLSILGKISAIEQKRIKRIVIFSSIEPRQPPEFQCHIFLFRLLCIP